MTVVYGIAGLGVMAALDMIDARPRKSSVTSLASYKQTWVRAQRGGIVHMQVELGDRVVRRQPLAVISDPMGEREYPIRSPGEGYVIGGITNPLVNRGDAVLHITLIDQQQPRKGEMPKQLDKPVVDATAAMRLPADSVDEHAEHTGHGGSGGSKDV